MTVAEQKVDVITMSLINNSLASLIDEMAMTIVRTTTSPPQRDTYDFLCSLTNADGEVLMEGEEAVLHTNLFDPIIHDLLKNRGIDYVHPGDMFCINDPFSGASHFPDVMVLHPVFYNEQLVAWTSAGGHVLDIGGRVAGSCDCLSRTSYEEGLRIPMVKIYDRGVRNDTFFELLSANSRIEQDAVNQMEPFLAACRIGEKHFLELIRKHSWQALKTYLAALLDYAETRARAEITALPNGVYEFEDFLDDDGFSSNPIRFYVKITVDGDTMTYDFTGSSPQIDSGMNNPVATTRAQVYTGFRSLVSSDIPHNGGALRPLRIITPKGTIVNPALPGATGARGVTFARINETVLGAQAQIAADKMPACAEGINTMLVFSGYDKKRRKKFVFCDLPWGAWVGRPTADGDHLAPLYLNGAVTPVEVVEDLFPLRYGQRSFLPDSEGAGKYRGGFALVIDYETLLDDVTLQLRSDRRKFPPYGLSGGKPGSLAKMSLNPDGENLDLGKCVVEMDNGDIMRVRTAGAGGWGNPLERDAELVLDDVRNEKVSVKRAREVYGVIIDEATMELDVEQTKRLRQKGDGIPS